MRLQRARIGFTVTLLALSITSLSLPAQASRRPASELRPQNTKENGLSCGRTSSAGKGVSCVAKQCYSPPVREFADWTAFENGFLRRELNQSGLLGRNANFTDLCPGYSRFNSEEKELFWLDIIKLVAAFESNFLSLTAYDDWVGGKVATGRGLFQVGVSDCIGHREVADSYCALHQPKVNARCAVGLMARLVGGRKGKAMDALSAHWGSFRGSARNSEGGRREQIAQMFGKHPACKTGVTVRFDRLKPEMFTDSDFARGKLRPSYPHRIKDPCEQDQSVATNKEQCTRAQNYAYYDDVDRKSSEQNGH